jgi:hypothetical protein
MAIQWLDIGLNKTVQDIGTEGLDLTTQAAHETDFDEYCRIMREIENIKDKG